MAAWTTSVSDLSYPPMAEEHAVALINEAVRDHNRERLAQLTDDRQRALGSVDVALDYLQEVKRLTGRQDGVDLLVMGCRAIRSMFDGKF